MIGLTIMVGLFLGLALYSMCCACQITHQGEPSTSSLEQDAMRDWDEQVKALGCTEPELYFSKPYLSGERPIFNAGGLTFEKYHAAALERFYAFSEGGVIGPLPPTTNELNS